VNAKTVKVFTSETQNC